MAGSSCAAKFISWQVPCDCAMIEFANGGIAVIEEEGESNSR